MRIDVLHKLASNITSQHNIFNIKQEVNKFVIQELTKAMFPGQDDREHRNEIANMILESDIHKSIQELAQSISREIEKAKLFISVNLLIKLSDLNS